MRAHSLSLVTALLACLLLAAGCGDDSDDEGGGGSSDSGGTAYGAKQDSGGGGGSAATQLKLTAEPWALKFDKTTLSAKPGKATVVLDNPSSVPHAIEVEGKGVEAEGETVEKGGVSKVTVDLKPGEYEYYCPVDGHKQAGMEGTLTVG